MSNTVPKHIGFILDGNRRWAKERGMTSFQGHDAGFKRAKEIIDYANNQGLEAITMYCFSKENWSRSKEEVGYLMAIFTNFVKNFLDELHGKNMQLRHLGDLEGLSKGLVKVIGEALEKTKDNTGLVVQLALNYTGRDEIKRAVEKLVEKKLPVTIENISDNLDTSGTSDPDLIVRTSGEQRLSGFLLWQASYSEFYFAKVHWPDFTTLEFDKAVLEYNSRQRRFGGN
ncbi:MAG: polyprenyl diphosphate synthase [Patescibacteria group bacterium]|jgi:undecaprenyl diphosphate synthase